MLTLVRAHKGLVGLVGVAAALRCLTMVSYDPILLFQSDAYVYLNKSLELTPSHLRPLMYSLFLKGFLPFHDLRLVAAAQHVLGILIGISVYAVVWRRTRSRALALAASVLPLFDAYVLLLEHYGLAETLFTALAWAGFLLLVWNDDFHPAAVVAAGLCLGLAVLARYAGLVLIVPALLIILTRRVAWTKVIAFLVAFAIPLLIYAAWFKSSAGVFAITTRGGHFLYGRVASFMDCERDLELPPHQEVLCEVSPRPTRPNPNHFVFGDESPARRVEVPEGETLDEVLRDFSFRVIRSQPDLYVKEVGADLVHYIAPGRWTGPQDNRLNIIRFPITPEDAEPFAPLVEQRQGSPPPRWDDSTLLIRDPPASWLRAYQSVVYLHGPLLAAMLVVIIVGLFRVRRRELVLIAGLGAAATLLMAFPVLTVTFDYRFEVPAIPFLCAGTALALSALMKLRDAEPDRPAREDGSA